MNEQEVIDAIQATIDWMENTISHDQLPSVYDRLVEARDTLETVLGVKPTGESR